MPAANRLVGLPFAAILRAVHLESRLIARGAKAAPEGGGDAPVIRGLDHAHAAPVLYELTPFAAELKFVPRVIDRPRDVRPHEDAAADGGDHFVEAPRTRPDVRVRQPTARPPVPPVGARFPRARHARPKLREAPAERRDQ